MSARIDQLNYWTRPPTSKDTSLATEGGPGGGYLSYHVLLGLSVLGGFFALDHLYLRSPLTFLGKILVNIFFLGVWWLYDAFQVIFNRDVTKVFGLSVPVLGPKGIGAGSLASDVPDKKHMAFFYYALALLFGGLIGLDSFLVGDTQTGLIRLISTITFIGIPIALAMWAFHLGRFLFFTKDTIDANYEYFGAPMPGEAVASALESAITQIPVVGTVFSAVMGVKKTAETVIDNILRRPALVQAIVDPVVKSTIEPLTKTAQSAVNTVGKAVDTARTAIDSGTAIAQGTLQTVDTATKTASQALQLVPGAVAMDQLVTPDALRAAAATAAATATAAAAATAQTGKALVQKGGALAQDGGILPYVFLGTIGLIAVSGFVLSFLRSRQNEPRKPRKDDAPPEPGVLRKPDQEKSTRSA